MDSSVFLKTGNYAKNAGITILYVDILKGIK